jgi:hypothetical protein
MKMGKGYILKSKEAKGFTVVEVLTSAAIGVVVLMILGKSLNMLNANSKKLEAFSELNLAKSMILGEISCQRTFASLPARPPCSGAGRYIDILNDTGRVLVGSGGTKFGSWTIRALCAPNGISIRGSNILPAHESRTDELTDWRGRSTPANPELYKKDHAVPGSTNTFSWAHPLSEISRAGPSGLCTEYFSRRINHAGCPAGYYLKDVNFDTNDVTCVPTQNCIPPLALKFDGTSFVCSNDLNNRITGESETYLQRRKAEIQTFFDDKVAELIRERDILVNLPSQTFNPANDYRVEGSNDRECKSLGRMRCRSGFVMTSYEMRYGFSGYDGCSMNCRQVGP